MSESKQRPLDLVQFKVVSLVLNEVAELPSDYKVQYEYRITLEINQNMTHLRIILDVRASIMGTEIEVAKIQTASQFQLHRPRIKKKDGAYVIRRHATIKAIEQAISTTRGALVVLSPGKPTSAKPMPIFNPTEIPFPDPLILESKDQVSDT